MASFNAQSTYCLCFRTRTQLARDHQSIYSHNDTTMLMAIQQSLIRASGSCVSCSFHNLLNDVHCMGSAHSSPNDANDDDIVEAPEFVEQHKNTGTMSSFSKHQMVVGELLRSMAAFMNLLVIAMIASRISLGPKLRNMGTNLTSVPMTSF